MASRMTAWAALAAATIVSSGCGSAGSPPAASNSPRAVAAPGPVNGATAAKVSCGSGAAVLTHTRLCQEQASALILSAGEPDGAPEGCTWVVNEAKMLDREALLYRAMRCDGGTAQLEFAPGARAASFGLVASPFGPLERPEPIAILFDADALDPHAVILKAARREIEDPAERARCKVRRLNGDVASPADALVVDEVPVSSSGEVRSACGEFGFDGGSQTFWRVSQNSAWFFTLGNDTAPVDPESFTLISRNNAGEWVRS